MKRSKIEKPFGIVKGSYVILEQHLFDKINVLLFDPQQFLRVSKKYGDLVTDVKVYIKNVGYAGKISIGFCDYSNYPSEKNFPTEKTKLTDFVETIKLK